MIALIKNNISRIQDVCKQHHVKSLYAFGSAVEEQRFSSSSDIDFLYEIDIDHFSNWSNGEYDYVDNLLALEKDLLQLLNTKVDLIPYQGIRNKYFKESVDKTRQLIYGK